MSTAEERDQFVGELSADRFKVSKLREGRLRVPHFQRPLRWRRDRPGLGEVVAVEVIQRRAARLHKHVEEFLRSRARWGDDGDIPAFEAAFADDAEAV
jgi:hypothetical protein